MTLEQRGIYIDLLALAWDSDQPGVISMSIPEICRELRVYSTTLERLLAEFPATWQKVNGKLVNPKLVQQYAKYCEISEKRSGAAKSRYANAEHLHHSASASASANKDFKSSSRSANGLDDLKKSFLSKCEDPQGVVAAAIEVICARAAESGVTIHSEAYLLKATEEFDFAGGQDKEDLQQFLRRVPN
jgi:uncharacterized protein YdaU (DUF1376 family)